MTTPSDVLNNDNEYISLKAKIVEAFLQNNDYLFSQLCHKLNKRELELGINCTEGSPQFI